MRKLELCLLLQFFWQGFAVFRSSSRVTDGPSRIILHAGNGKTYPHYGEIVRVHYVGTLEDGTKFDSSRDRGKPLEFTLGVGKVIPCWDQGVMQMSIGERAKLTCPPERGSERTLACICSNMLLAQLIDVGGNDADRHASGCSGCGGW